MSRRRSSSAPAMMAAAPAQETPAGRSRAASSGRMMAVAIPVATRPKASPAVDSVKDCVSYVGLIFQLTDGFPGRGCPATPWLPSRIPQQPASL